MKGTNEAELLKDERVRREIDQYKWVESEKAGHDIGFERASREWMERFSKDWIKKQTAPERKPTRSAKRLF